MDWKVAYIVLLSAFFSFQVFADSVRTSPCTITIKTIRNSGESVYIQFTTRLHTRQNCMNLAAFHRPNFEADSTRSKEVKYAWNIWPKRKSYDVQVIMINKPLRGYIYSPKKKAMYLAKR
jgi:hypothetical protein